MLWAGPAASTAVQRGGCQATALPVTGSAVMPYRLVGGTRFYQRREIKDALAYLRLAHNPADNVSLG